MTSGYFEDIEVGDSRKAGPYFVSKDEIIQFARQYDPRPFHIDEKAAVFLFKVIETNFYAPSPTSEFSYSLGQTRKLPLLARHVRCTLDTVAKVFWE